jgi:predicted dehydrogenase
MQRPRGSGPLGAVYDTQVGNMASERVGIIVNGATGRMGTTQHVRHLVDIGREGGLPLRSGDRLVPDVLIVGRDAERLQALGAANGGLRWSTDVGAALAGPDQVFMECAATGRRPALVRRAIAAGKHVLVEKPTAPDLAGAIDLARLAQAAGVRTGVIQDKLYNPGFAKLIELKRIGFFGRMLSIRIEAGAWIFDGEEQACQRPSWNYRRRDEGGLALDMMAHWRYMLEGLGAPVRRVVSHLGTAIPTRVDERGERYDVDVDDTVHALFRLDWGIMAAVTNSWAMRVRREDTIVVQIDGTGGSAAAGRHRCFAQAAAETPDAFTAAAAGGVDFAAQWAEVPDNGPYANPYRRCWEEFLRHVWEDAAYASTLLAGAKAVQLAELVYASEREGKWLEVPDLEL